MKILLLTPPLLQPNAPYAATPAIAGFLRSQGVDVVQADLSLSLVLKLFSREGMEVLSKAAKNLAPKGFAAAQWFLEHEAEYCEWVEPVVRFLQGKAPELAWSIVQEVLPEGPHFRELQGGDDEESFDFEGELFGTLGVMDRAKMRASLFLDDVSELFRELVDSDFGFSRYAEHLALAIPTMDPILKRLQKAKKTWVDQQIDSLTETLLCHHKPTHVGLTVPFPGTLYGAFRVAQAVRRIAPELRLVVGGGYVNSELREMEDPRVFDYFDEVCYDEGFAPWLGILGMGPRVRTLTRETLGTQIAGERSEQDGGWTVVPDYTGLELESYFSLMETANPMQRLWSDGCWLKMQLANGCYWHRCAFCDVALDAIGCYRAPTPEQAVEAILEVKHRTGRVGFHFTDEALEPGLVRGLCEELLRRHERIVWWGNVRLDKGFSSDLPELMKQAGCIAVTAGLECANDRLLRLMRKGITLASARKACRAFSEAGIMVHVYLMYGFPTETVEETLGALESVRQFFEEGLIQSAFWHRFALTVHSPIAREPERFGITLVPEKKGSGPRFARNEIPYTRDEAQKGDLDDEVLGKGLQVATYNYMRGRGFEVPIEDWFGGE